MTATHEYGRTDFAQAGLSLASFTDYYWPRRAGLVPHLIGGLLAIFAGLVQIWLGLTDRVSSLHRVLGKVYSSGVLIGSLGGFYLALSIPGHLPYRVGLLGLNAAWLITTGMALYAISLCVCDVPTGLQLAAPLDRRTGRPGGGQHRHHHGMG